MAAPSGIPFQQSSMLPSWSTCGMQQYCAASTILANRYGRTAARLNATAGTTGTTVGLYVDSADQRGYWVEMLPADYIEPRAGDWTCELYVQTGNANVKLSKVFVCHVGTLPTFPPTSCASKGTFGSATPNITLSASGVTHQVTVTGSAMANWNPGVSRVFVVFCFENTAGSIQSIVVQNRGIIYMPGVFAFRPGIPVPDATARVIHPRFQNVPGDGVVQPGGGGVAGVDDGVPDDQDPSDETFLAGFYDSQTRPADYTNPNRRLWSTKRCGKVIFRAHVLAASDLPEGEQHNVGLRRPITAHPVRAEQRSDNSWAHQEHCKMHYGRVVRGPRGLKRIVHCYRPDTRERAYGLAVAVRPQGFNAEAIDPSTGEPYVHPGRTAGVGMMRLPQTFVGTYYGPAVACGVPV